MTVSCDSGYSIFGNGVIECQTGGVWNASAGTCGKGILAHWIRISEISLWDSKYYLTHAILPRTSSILAYSGTYG